MGKKTNTAATILLVDDLDEYRNIIKRGWSREAIA